jgi:hypothetical protein
MNKIPRDGIVVRVIKLGRDGYEFRRPAFAITSDKANPATAQVGLFFLTVEPIDSDEVLHTQSQGEGDPGFCAIPQHVVRAKPDDAAVALALYRLNGERVFVKPLNNTD